MKINILVIDVNDNVPSFMNLPYVINLNEVSQCAA